VLSVCATRRAWRLTSSAAGLAADEAGDGVARPAGFGDLATRGVQLVLQAAELADQGLHGGLGVVQQHEAQGADDLVRARRAAAAG
jgi:hypothetical protein